MQVYNMTTSCFIICATDKSCMNASAEVLNIGIIQFKNIPVLFPLITIGTKMNRKDWD
jgi:hypothetical protein